MGYDKQQAQHEFTRWSESYDRSILQRILFGPSHRAIITRLRRQFVDRPIRVLDVGCGTGIFAERIRAAMPQAQVVGIDLVAGMLNGGRTRWATLRDSVFPVQADSERLPFASGAFDAVTCANSFHHYPNQQRAVREMARVLRPGGHLLLLDGFRDRPYGWFIYEVCVAGIEGSVHHASRHQVRQMFTEARLGQVDQTVHRGLAPFLLTEAVAPALEGHPQPTFAPGAMAGVAR